MRHLLILIGFLPLCSSGQGRVIRNERNNKQKSYSDYSKNWLTEPGNNSDTAKGEKTYYYPGGALKAKGNKTNGDWTEFFESGGIKLKQSFINGKLSGETYCYLENGNILLPRFIPQTTVKNDTSVLNNSDLNLARLFDSRDSANDILNLGEYISDHIQICDNGNLTIRVGAIQFIVKPKLLGVHVNFDTLCKENIMAQRFSVNRINEETGKVDKNPDYITEKEYFKTGLGKIEIEHKPKLCDNTGHNTIRIISNDKSIYFKDTGNLIFFEYDVDKGGTKELFILNYYPCEERLEMYKIDD